MANKKNYSIQDDVASSMVEVFNRASSANIEGVTTTETKDGSIIASKEYKFLNPIGKRTTLKTFDKSIIESTEKIGMALYGQNVLTFAVCRELAKMDDKSKLDSLGFKNIGEYANALFDISRVTATQYARIGKVFINDEYKIASDILPSGLQKGHLLELLTMVSDDGDISEVENLYLDGTLTDGMATTAIRKVVKDWKNGTLAIETTGKEIPQIEDKGEKSEKSKNVSRETSGNSENNSGEFDVQIEVGKILSACNSITESFDILNRHEFNVGGYEKALDTIRALAQAMLQ